jgi:hypothetical protein
MSRKTYYKWNNRYKQKGIEGLHDLSKVPQTIRYKVSQEIEEFTINYELCFVYLRSLSNNDAKFESDIYSGLKQQLLQCTANQLLNYKNPS